MHTRTGSRWLPGLLALAMLAAALALPTPAAAAQTQAGQLSHSLLASASWHGRPIERPLQPHRLIAATPLTRLAGWSAGPARRGLGFVRAGGSRRVREVQRLLRRIGYRPGPVDGLFGPRTEAAVVDFQYKHGLSSTGVVGSQTLLHLKARARAHWPSGWAAGEVRIGSGYSRPTGSDRVRQVQRRLRRLGYSSGPVDGLFGPLTERAVTRFQRRHGLEVDGVVGLRSLAALGLLSSARPPNAVRPIPAVPAPPLTAAPRQRPAPSTRPALPLGVIVPSLALLGLLVGLVSYLRTMARLRRAAPRLGNREEAKPLGNREEARR
jgi:peptidoglycan hydrolase-like protein with peptidoglycan-binding domain